MIPLLSILIPSLVSRRAFLDDMLSMIYNQEGGWPLSQIEVLVSIDNARKTIGQKRNELLRSANGKYVVFIDDDDTISRDYLIRVFEGIVKDVDHIGISMEYSENGGPKKLVRCSKDHVWEEKDNVYYRSAQHVCPIKRELAIQVTYPETSFGEDMAYSKQINQLIQTEYLIDEPIYFYNYRSKK